MNDDIAMVVVNQARPAGNLADDVSEVCHIICYRSGLANGSASWSEWEQPSRFNKLAMSLITAITAAGGRWFKSSFDVRQYSYWWNDSSNNNQLETRRAVLVSINWINLWGVAFHITHTTEDTLAKLLDCSIKWHDDSLVAWLLAFVIGCDQALVQCHPLLRLSNGYCGVGGTVAYVEAEYCLRAR